MDEVRDIDAKERLDALLDRVEQGEEITITRAGKPVARLVPELLQFDHAEAQAAMQRILEIGDGVSLGGLTFKDLISEGRKY